MNELIKVTYDNDRPAVSARDLHDFLEVGARYNDWFPRMCEYGFTEGEDAAGGNEKPYTCRGDCQCGCRTGFDGCHCFYVSKTLDVHRSPSAGSVQACACGPDTYCPKIAFLGSHPVNEFAGKEHTNCVND